MSEINPRLEELTWQMLKHEVVKFGGPFTLRDRESVAYVNTRDMISLPEVFDNAVDAYSYVFENEPEMMVRPDGQSRHMAGIPEAGLYYAGALAYQIGGQIPLLQRRVALKKHGEPKVIEGRYETGDEVVLIDDAITSAGSKLNEAELFKQAGLDVTGVVVLVDREQGGRTELQSHGIDFAAAMTLRGIAQYAIHERLGNVTQTMYDELLGELDQTEIGPNINT